MDCYIVNEARDKLRPLQKDQATLSLTVNNVKVPIAVTASTYQNDELAGEVHPPDQSIDGDTSTRWSAEGEQWIQYEFDKVTSLGAIEIIWYQGAQRRFFFDLEVSDDAVTWTNIFADAASTGLSSTYERFNFIDVQAKYLRYVGHGNSVNGWNSIVEVKIFGATGSGTSGQIPQFGFFSGAEGDGQNTISWSVSTDTIDIERATSISGPWTEVASGVTPDWIDNNVTNGTEYHYRGIAFNTAGVTTSEVISLTPRAASTGGGTDPDPTVLADLGEYMSQSGGQTIVIPNGTYSLGTIDNHTHTDFLTLKAETAGGVTINGSFDPSGCSRIRFLGLHFDDGIYTGSNDRMFFWFCTARAASQTRPIGVRFGGGQRYLWAGGEIYDCYHDGMRLDCDDILLAGTRIWNIDDPQGEFHNDVIQSTKGLGNIVEYCVFGLRPDGTPDGNGHVQLQAHLNAVDITVRHTWITKAGNTAITLDGHNGENGPCHGEFHFIRYWNNNYNSINVTRGATSNQSNNTTAEPSDSIVPPDTKWKGDNPYESYDDFHNNVLSGLGW